jgi:thioredoxin reductase (NADPH)
MLKTDGDRPGMRKSDAAIIGAGPAGISAALQLARYEIYPFVYEADTPGGLLYNAGTVENYPGFPKGIEGPELAALFAEGLAASEAEVCPEEVLSVDYAAGVFRVRAETEADFSRLSDRRRGCGFRLCADAVEEERYRDHAEGREASLQRRARETGRRQ